MHSIVQSHTGYSGIYFAKYQLTAFVFLQSYICTMNIGRITAALGFQVALLLVLRAVIPSGKLVLFCRLLNIG